MVDERPEHEDYRRQRHKEKNVEEVAVDCQLELKENQRDTFMTNRALFAQAADFRLLGRYKRQYAYCKPISTSFRLILSMRTVAEMPVKIQ